MFALRVVLSYSFNLNCYDAYSECVFIITNVFMNHYGEQSCDIYNPKEVVLTSKARAKGREPAENGIKLCENARRGDTGKFLWQGRGGISYLFLAISRRFGNFAH